MRYAKDLLAKGNCREAVRWLGERSLEEGWKVCENPQWLLWWIGRTIDCPAWSDGRKPLLACALDCAETVRHLWPESHREKMGESVAVLRGWVAGSETVEEAKQARRNLSAVDAAYAAYADAAAAYASAAASAAAYAYAAAAYAAYAYAYAAAAYAAAAVDAAYVAYVDADAAYAYAYAAAAAGVDAWQKHLAICADIVRRHYPEAP